MGASASVNSQESIVAALSGLTENAKVDTANLVSIFVQQIQKLTEQVALLEKSLQTEQLKQIQESLNSRHVVTGNENVKNKVEKTSTTEQTTKSESNYLGDSAKSCQVMISFNCRSNTENAKALKELLEKMNIPTWICVDLTGGIEFRDAIVDAVDSCKVFLPLINTEWALSPECESEFAYAYRKNLSSKDRLPVILPVVFPNLDWNRHKHVRLLLASTNALVWKDDDKSTTFNDIAMSLRKCGLPSTNSDVTTWTRDDALSFLGSVLLRPFSNAQDLSGRTLLQCSEDQFMRDFGLSALYANAIKSELPGGSDTATGMTSNSILVVSICQLFFFTTGVYKCQAKTINNYDANVTESNEFDLFMNRGYCCVL